MKKTPNLRLLAARIIDEVTEGHSLSDCLEPALAGLSARDRAFVQAICFGVCRFYTRLDVLLESLLKKPLNAKDSDLHALLLVGLYQLSAMRTPDYAAVTETVNAAQDLGKAWAKGLTNAVLREYLRRKEELDAKIETDEEALYAHPYWWIKATKTAWPNEWSSILEANNIHPPMSLRVNQQKISRADYLQKLNPNAQSIPETIAGVVLDTPIPAADLPGFATGEVAVQDGAAQLAAELLSVRAGQRVLDACAAPGGKLCHLLEIEPDLDVIAVEKDAQRIKTIHENLARLNLNAKCICADAANVKSWWDGNLFDRILLDAPCSASGVIRRHPDIKLLRCKEDMPALAQEQTTLLNSLWPLLKTDGLLLYVTCSIFPEENVVVMQQFLAAHSDAVEEKITANWGVTCDIGRQILPGMHNMDGFYYALLKKV